MARIVDSILVDDKCPDQSTELDQRMPIAAIARKPGGFDCKHSSRLSFADGCEQPLEAGPADTAARAAEIIVDDLNPGPTKLPGAIGKPILAPPAFLIVHELISRRLADVDEGASRKMLSRDLGHRRLPQERVLPQSRAGALPEAPPAASCAVLPTQRLALPGRNCCGLSRPPFLLAIVFFLPRRIGLEKS